MESERRAFPRTELMHTIGIEIGQERAYSVVARDFSDGGVRFGTFAELSIGDELTVCWPADEPGEARRLPGRVVRFEAPRDPHATIFTRIAAVQFDEPVVGPLLTRPF